MRQFFSWTWLFFNHAKPFHKLSWHSLLLSLILSLCFLSSKTHTFSLTLSPTVSFIIPLTFMLALCHVAWCHGCHFESFYYIWITPRTLRESARCGSTELGWNTKEMIKSFFRLTTISNSCRVGQDTHWERCRWWNRPTSWPRRRKKVFPEKFVHVLQSGQHGTIYLSEQQILQRLTVMNCSGMS